MNLATFRVQYPEFKSALDPFVQAFLDAAAREINPTELGEAYDNAHGLLTAHKLASRPAWSTKTGGPRTRTNTTRPFAGPCSRWRSPDGPLRLSALRAGQALVLED
jgi:hypothetical protein